jgi:hypothetical protein
MKRSLLLLSIQLLAFWEVWQWYVYRAVYSWDQPWGILAFVTALAFLWSPRKPLPTARQSLLLPALLITIYGATYPVCPPLIRATIAFTALAVTISSIRFGKAFHPGLFGLFYLSLPTIPTLQFFGGSNCSDSGGFAVTASWARGGHLQLRRKNDSRKKAPKTQNHFRMLLCFLCLFVAISA